MMLPHGSIVGAASSGGTGLEYHIREFRRQRLKNTFIAPHVVNGQIPLAAGIQPGRAGVGNFAVAIPFDVGNTRMPPKQLPHGIKNVPAYMRIAQVQQILAAFQPVFPMRETDDPLRMVLIKLRMRVHHFRLHPDAEAYSQFFRLANEAFQSMRQFSAVNLPVPQSGTGVIAGEPAAKPAVIQHEKLYPQVCRTFHHAVQHFFRKGKIHPLPGIQQGRPL